MALHDGGQDLVRELEELLVEAAGHGGRPLHQSRRLVQ